MAGFSQKAKKAYRRKYYNASKDKALKQSNTYYMLNTDIIKKASASNTLPKKLAAKNKYMLTIHCQRS